MKCQLTKLAVAAGRLDQALPTAVGRTRETVGVAWDVLDRLAGFCCPVGKTEWESAESDDTMSRRACHDELIVWWGLGIECNCGRHHAA